MKFVCMGYAGEAQFEQTPKAELDAMIEACLAYDDELMAKGHFIGGRALQSSDKTVTLRFQNGNPVATDGPYAEAKEVIGGILILEARDMAEAVELMLKHPGVRFGPFEIRPVDEDFEAFMEQRRTSKANPR